MIDINERWYHWASFAILWWPWEFRSRSNWCKNCWLHNISVTVRDMIDFAVMHWLDVLQYILLVVYLLIVLHNIWCDCCRSKQHLVLMVRYATHIKALMPKLPYHYYRLRAFGVRSTYGYQSQVWWPPLLVFSFSNYWILSKHLENTDLSLSHPPLLTCHSHMRPLIWA